MEITLLIKGAAISIAWVVALGLAPVVAAQESDVRVVLKFVKADAWNGPAAIFDPASCPACVLVQDPAFARDNSRETLIDLRVPHRRTLELAFDAPIGAVRRVIMETSDVAFTQVADRLTVHLPPIVNDAINAGEFHTHIVEPGMVLRFEHDDPARRAGAYSDAPLDFVQRRAADVLTFAQREVIRQLGLGEIVDRESLGRIMLMGFDTNYPHGHTDAPAHMHMHMRWPDRAGTQISHYYIDERGLLVRNEVGIQMIGAPEQTFGPEQPFTTVDLRGRPVYTHTITREGWLRIADALNNSCLVEPREMGFESGAIVSCDQTASIEIVVLDDGVEGILKVVSGTTIELFRYDTDTGMLLGERSPVASPSNATPNQ